MKKTIIVIVLILIVLVLVRLFIGHQYIKIKVPYNNPIYQLSVNGEIKGMDMEINKNQTILPSALTLVYTAHLFTSPSMIDLNYGDNIILSVSGYYCFSDLTGKEKQVACSGNDKIIKEIEDITFNNMKITGGSEIGLTNDLIYEGKYIENISQLLLKKGKFQIEISLEHQKINSNLFFIIDLK